MRKYEIMYILDPNLNKDEIQTTRGELEHAITSKGGKLKSEDVWGLRDLAYEINGHKKGYYVIINVEAPSEAIKEFDRLGRINKKRLRHLIVNVDEEDVKKANEAYNKFLEYKKEKELEAQSNDE